MEASMEDVAFEACLGLRELRFGDMRWDNHCYLPRGHPTLGWGMMNPVNLDPIPQVMVNFIYDLMEKNERLEEMVVAQGKSLNRCYQVIDNHRVMEGLPKIYEELEYEPHP
jgi:hypothetical protein